MQRHREDLRDFVSVPLREAMLCVDCECVTSSRFDNCPVCGSHSVFAVAPVLGGIRGHATETSSARCRNPVCFDLEIRVALRGIDAHDMNTVVEGITGIIPSSLSQQSVAFHLDVDPVTIAPARSERRAA